jgi:hypothetical protein
MNEKLWVPRKNNLQIICPDLDGFLDDEEISSLHNTLLDDINSADLRNPSEEFIDICMSNLGIASKYLIGVELLPFQQVILDVLWHKTFPLIVATRGGSKSFIYAAYAILRALLNQGSKVIIVSASFRQAKQVFGYINKMWDDWPILRAACPKKPSWQTDMCRLDVGHSVILAIPLGDGEKIRGLRGTHILVDETASVRKDILDVVIRGFAAVTASPVSNVKKIHKMKKLANAGLSEYADLAEIDSNQLCLAGTARFTFNHFYKTLKTYENIIKNKIKGRAQDYDGIIDSSSSAKFVDWTKYAVIMLPYTCMPEGFMDQDMIEHSRADMSTAYFDMEYNCKFIGDSDSFFSALSIENATAGNEIVDINGNSLGGDKPIMNPLFHLELSAEKDTSYVIGIDPARWSDNCVICVLRLFEQSYRLVYMDSWNRTEWGKTMDRIWKAFKAFPAQRIAIDRGAGGGGDTIIDFLRDDRFIPKGAKALLPDEEEFKTNDGLKIIEPIQFVNAEWLTKANFDMQSDIHHKRLMFPATYLDEHLFRKYPETERIEHIFGNIEECKRELMQIQLSVTEAGRHKFGIPKEIEKQEGIDDDKILRKDRYCALLMASYLAHQYIASDVTHNKPIVYPDGFGWADMSID